MYAPVYHPGVIFHTLLSESYREYQGTVCAVTKLVITVPFLLFTQNLEV